MGYIRYEGDGMNDKLKEYIENTFYGSLFVVVAVGLTWMFISELFGF